jgi:2-dehydro-3-deoxygluconokinase
MSLPSSSSSSSSPPSLVTFGEILLRLDPAGADRIVQARGFEARYTGAEANVAASLSGMGMATEVVSAVPENAVGQASLNYLRQFGVGTGAVVRLPGRLGLLFHEPGGAGRAPSVIYDRAGSVFATCGPRCYDWRSILSERSWLHISGTAPALGPRVLTAVTDAMATARELGVRVSLDLNFRASLWSHQAAGAVLAPLLEYVDVLIGLGPDAAGVFGLDLPPRDVLEGNVDLARRLRDRYRVAVVAGIVRPAAPPGEQPRRTQLVGVAVDAEGAHVSAGYPVLDPVGRIGTGDAFTAGLLRGLLVGAPASEAVEFAAAAAHLKQSIRGDINIVTVDEVEAVLRGTDTDRVRR